jgi:hypothetical protein
MRPRPGRPSPMAGYRQVIALGLALCAVAPSLADERQLATQGWEGRHSHAVGAGVHACVDPSDALVRRRFQDEPCKLPLYHLPPPEVPKFGDLPRWPTHAAGSPARDSEHNMFWRFPVQGRGPHEVPRHSWR